MVSTRVALVTLVLAAGCAAKSAKETSSSAPSGGTTDKTETGRPPPTAEPHTPPVAPGDTPTPDPNAAREAARANGFVGTTDNRVGSGFKSGFDEEPKGGRGSAAPTAKPQADNKRIGGGGSVTPEPAKAPTLRVDIATLQGNPSGSLKSLAEDHLTELRACYDKARAKNADLKGRLDVSFSVNGEGTVIAPMVASTSTAKDRALGTCVIGIVAKLKLDRVATPPIKAVLVFVFGE